MKRYKPKIKNLKEFTSDNRLIQKKAEDFINGKIKFQYYESMIWELLEKLESLGVIRVNK